MDTKLFQMCLDTLSTYAHIHEQLCNTGFTDSETEGSKAHTDRGTQTLVQLEELIFDLVEALHDKTKGQVA